MSVRVRVRVRVSVSVSVSGNMSASVRGKRGYRCIQQKLFVVVLGNFGLALGVRG